MIPKTASELLKVMPHLPDADAAQTLNMMNAEQLLVTQYVLETEQSILVKATAGSGKSFLLKFLTRILLAKSAGRIGVFAFNSTIAAELRQALPKERELTCSTFHAYGRKVVENHSVRPIKLVEYKRRNVITSLNRKLEWELPKPQLEAFVRLSELAVIHLEASEEGLARLAEANDLVIEATLAEEHARASEQCRAI